MIVTRENLYLYSIAGHAILFAMVAVVAAFTVFG